MDYNRKNIIKTITDNVKIITALIVAITSLIAVVIKFWPESDSNSITSSQMPCLPKVEEPAFIKVFPLSLINSTKARGSLHWFDYSVNNICPETVFFTVEREAMGHFIKPGKKELGEYMIQSYKKCSEKVSDPYLEFIKTDFENDSELNITWRIYDSRQNKLYVKTESITVLPRDILYWNLTSPDGTPISQEYLLASLTAWMETGDSKIEDRINNILQRVKQVISEANTSEFANHWLKHCYTAHFLDSTRTVDIQSDDINKFPRKGRQRIRTPSQILKSGLAKPLEAVLFLGALSRKELSVEREVRLALFVMPNTGKTPHDYYFCWSAGNEVWHALNMSQVGTKSFEDNKIEASSQIERIIKDKPEIFSSLNKRGVFLDNQLSLVALDFEKAKRHFEIRGLP